MSSLRDALTDAGFDANETELMVALAKYLNNGGTVERAWTLLAEAAHEMPGEGQPIDASNGHEKSAPARQPDDGAEGQSGGATLGQKVDAPAPSPDRERGGQTSIAPKGHTRGAAAREPSAAQRTAAASVAKKAAASVLDTFKTRDGEAVGDLSVARLRKLAEQRERSAWTDAREAELFRLIAAKVGHAPAGAKVRDVIGADTLAEMIAKAADVAGMRSRITFAGEAGHA